MSHGPEHGPPLLHLGSWKCERSKPSMWQPHGRAMAGNAALVEALKHKGLPLGVVNNNPRQPSTSTHLLFFEDLPDVRTIADCSIELVLFTSVLGLRTQCWKSGALQPVQGPVGRRCSTPHVPGLVCTQCHCTHTGQDPFHSRPF